MKTQRDFIKEIQKLADDNPKAPIKICVDSEEVLDYGWTAHKITRVELSCWIEFDERIYTDEDIAKDAIGEMLYDSGTKDLSDSDYQTMIDKYFSEHAIEAICVYTNAS